MDPPAWTRFLFTAPRSKNRQGMELFNRKRLVGSYNFTAITKCSNQFLLGKPYTPKLHVPIYRFSRIAFIRNFKVKCLNYGFRVRPTSTALQVRQLPKLPAAAAATTTTQPVPSAVQQGTPHAAVHPILPGGGLLPGEPVQQV